MPEIARNDSERPGLIGRATALMAVALTAAMFLVCCSLDYQEAGGEEKAAEGIPDTVARGLVHKVHKNGRLSLELEAARAETFSASAKTILTDAHFIEFDEKGGKATEGRARKVVYHTDTENAEISGAVRVHSASEKGDVSAESLAWTNKERRLTAPPEERVIMRKDDGTSITGSGFVGNFRTREVTFSGPVQGTYVWQEKNK
jgi:LPS export ABC transporter protein LptC